MIKVKHLLESEDSKHAAGIAYIVGDELLCVQSTSGRWGIPKGHRHVDETPEEGAHREFTEETQIILNRDIELSHIGKKKNGGDFHVFICKGQKKFVPHIGHEQFARVSFFHLKFLSVGETLFINFLSMNVVIRYLLLLFSYLLL